MMITTYEFAPEKKASLNKRMMAVTAINYLIVTGIIAYPFIFKDSNPISKMIMGAVVVALVGFGWYSAMKMRAYANSYQLIIDDDRITLQGYKKAEQTIKFENIKEVWQERRGLKLVHKENGQRPLLISNSFERFDEIKSRLEARGFALLAY